MSKMPFFKFYTDDFIAGTMAMTAAELGDYCRMLCFLYDQGGRVKNDAHVLRHVLHCTQVRQARAKVERLLELGKLSIDAEGYIHNGRVDREISLNKWGIKAASEAPDPPFTWPKNPMKSSRARDRANQNPDIYNLLLQSSSLAINGRLSAASGPSPGCEGRSGPPPQTALSQRLVAKGLKRGHH
jgi:uncharacterized protein YdaU (DUF1376 family)